VVSAMSRYDEEYQAHFTGLRGYKLYAHGTFYAKDIEYNPIKQEILVGPTNGFGTNGDVWLQNILELASKNNLVFKKITEIYPSRYELSDLAMHPTIVIFPYSPMSYSIVDFYLSNLPIFVPSIEILTKDRSVFDRSVYFNPYCGKFDPIQPYDFSKHGKMDPNSDQEADYRFGFFFRFY